MADSVAFTGYAALFDVRDRGGDTIRHGAFAGQHAPLPLLWQHDPTRRIGVIDAMEEDAHGLKVSGRIDGGGGCADAARRLIAHGQMTGLSFGYRVRGACHGAAMVGQHRRTLTALDIVEVSLVTHPMQPGARVTRVSKGARG